MDFRKLSDFALAEFSNNVQTRLSAHEVTCLDNALADDLAAALAPLNTAFETVVAASVAITAAKQSVNADKATQRSVLIDRLADVLTYLRATHGLPLDYEMCGFSYPKSPSTVIPADPTDLRAVGTSNGVNTLTFAGNNKNGFVVYQIWRRHGDTADWGIVDTTRKQTFVDTPVTPGEYYQYKVRAAAASNVSNFSNTAVVYGAP